MPGTAVEQRLEREHLDFTLKLHRVLAGDPMSTACWSPFSVASALGLAGTGARGATRVQLARLLLGDSRAEADGTLRDHAAMLLSATRSVRADDTLLAVSNTLWARPDIPVRAEFVEELLDESAWPGGAIRDAPFRTDPDGARRLINADVAQITRGLIPELLGPRDIGPETLTTLVNALYLKDAWTNRFPDSGTEPRPFHGLDGEHDVSTMHLNKRLGYASYAGWQAVFLPARGIAEAVVLLPDAPLAEAEPVLRAKNLATLLATPTQRKVDLYLPKFRVTSRAGLTEALNRLGVSIMFTENADFSGISSVPLRVSDVVHEAVLTIDEQGLEGAAATAVAVALAMAVMADDPVVVRVDRPFLFLVRHRASGAVYFLARVVQPG